MVQLLGATAIPSSRGMPLKTSGPITSVAFSRDGGLLAVAHHHEIGLFTSSGQLRRRLPAGAAIVTAVAFPPDGKTLIAAGGLPGRSGELQLWSVAHGKQLARTRHHKDTVVSVAVSPDGRHLVAASYDRTLSLWELGPNLKSQISNPKSLVDHTEAVYAVAYSPEGKLIASASGDRTVKVWEVSTGKRLFTLSEATAELYALAWSPSGKQLAAGGVDRILRVWNVDATGGTLARSTFAHDAAILRVSFTPEGQRLVTAGEDRQVKFWHAATLEEAQLLERQTDWPLALALSPSGRVAIGRYDGVVLVYDSARGGVQWQSRLR